ncbi:AraC family transcriptional regulator [Massilia arenosa]|uniref:AraC family transcriptional regulator n=1 Tax=Zemynaea arenosa TaxID=2561931 RepID=A0A4Y9S0V3_9BURK|nr:AraC family transcriptional regulator [Massilia arenosa]TFW13656.1 AraC family transcriptional regulator [Massilia arenosa]
MPSSPIRQHDWVRHAPASDGVQRIEAFFAGHGYAPHRHDTYAIGLTLHGVQSFHYRGERRNSVAGGCIVLHPDEVHDGEAGTDAGFRYRIAYVPPARLQAILGGQPLPFLRAGLSADPRLLRAIHPLVATVSEPLAGLEEDDALFDLAMALQRAAGARPRVRSPDLHAADRARQLLEASLATGITLDELERACGRDRWSLSRDFRVLYGTSPYRYLSLRRLDLVRAQLRQGLPLAAAALNAGFADQSHMTRQFTRAFGLPPARWLALGR